MPRRIANLGRMLAGLLVVLLLYLAGVQVIWGPRLTETAQNPRLAIAAQEVEWGRILDRRLTVLADSATLDGRQVRRYADGPSLAHLLGYRSVRFGLSGLEARYDPQLLGLSSRDPWQALQRALGRRTRGDDLVLTIDGAVQRAAARALDGASGAVVAIDPRSGAILALASGPGFDPGRLDAAWPGLSGDSRAPLLDRATSGEYAPGSSFKPVVLAAAFARGRITPESRVDCDASITVEGAVIRNFEREAYGKMTVRDAFAASCNVAFVHIGLATGAARIVAAARAFGLGRPPHFDLPAAAGHLPDPAALDARGVAEISFGQGSLLVTPLQMALVASAIANRGVLMWPFVLSQVRAGDGRILESYAERGSQIVLPPAIDAEIVGAMVDAVAHGTGAAARIPGTTVAGKTGTAENPGGRTHAWFIAFAPAERPTVALAVLLEHGGVGGKTAAPAARRVLEAALAAQADAGGRP